MVPSLLSLARRQRGVCFAGRPSCAPQTPGYHIDALILHLFGEDVTSVARETGKKKRLEASTPAMTQNELADDKDGDVDDDDNYNDDTDAEEQEH